MFVVAPATVNSLLFTSVMPPTLAINTLSPLLRPCELAVTTAGLAFVMAVIAVVASVTKPPSLNIRI